MDKKALFLFNPHAGKEQIKSRLLDIIDILTKNGYAVTAHPTQCKGDARERMLASAKEYDLIVCSGGDGTLDEVVTGMMQAKAHLPIGYIPAGSTNDFASSLKLPKKMMKAAEVVVSGKTFDCDVGKFNDDIFVYIAAFGLFTDVSYETKQAAKNMLGHMAYILEGMKRLSSIQSYTMKVRADNGEFEGTYIYGMVTNSCSVGGFQNITGKNVKLDDGLFEVTLVKQPHNAVELNQIITALLSGSLDNDMMHNFKTKKILFEADEELPWTLDGEFGGTHRSVTIQNIHHAVRFCIP